MEELLRQKEALERQVKELQEELLIQKRKSKLKYFQDDFALMPQRERAKREWKDEPGWDRAERKKLLESIDFFPYEFAKEEHKLFILCYDMLDNLGFIETFKLPAEELKCFIITLRDSYRDVPFHNFYHAFNVSQTLYFFLTKCKASEKFTPLEQLAMLISAFCHDIDHPGVSNSFQCNVGTKKAYLYNDFSVLEMHHCNETFKLLNSDDTNFLKNLPPSDYKQVRKIICSCILATDLAVHGDYMSQLKSKMEKLDFSNFDDKKTIMCCLVKAADISNEVRSSQIGKQWAARVMGEFFSQAGLERAMGIPVLPHMDPEKTSTPGGQIGFIAFLCLPFFSIMATIFPEMQICVDNLNRNKNEWVRLENELKEKQAKK